MWIYREGKTVEGNRIRPASMLQLETGTVIEISGSADKSGLCATYPDERVEDVVAQEMQFEQAEALLHDIGHSLQAQAVVEGKLKLITATSKREYKLS
jgi:hypothetical protein